MVRAYAVEHGNVGLLNTPNSSYLVHDWPVWAADNGAFNAKTYVGDERWFAWLERMAPWSGNCLFATAPDVVGDAQATLDRSLPWLPQIRALGYKAALVAQDGLEHLDVPWDAFDVLFIGGTDTFKLGPAAQGLMIEAKARGKNVHVGRVNSHKRLAYAAHFGADTADGTFLAKSPDVNLPRMQWWFTKLNRQPSLFGGAA
jgi:hypothetical protein